jgi:fucose permease
MGHPSGAVFPALMGYIPDFSTIRTAFIVPLICHCYVLHFSLRGYRPVISRDELEYANTMQ